MTSEANAQLQSEPPFWKNLVLPAIAGFVTAIAVGPINSFFFTEGNFLEFQIAEQAAALVGLLYVCMSLGALMTALSSRIAGRLMKAEDAEALRDQRVVIGLSGLSMLCLGVALVLLVLAAPSGPLSGGIVLAGCGLLLALGLLVNYFAYRASDEMQKALRKEASAMAHFAALLLIGGWAFLAHLAILPALSPLGVLGGFYVASLAASIVAAARRGLLRMR